MATEITGTGRSWCPRCGEDIDEHATAIVDDEEHYICPVVERAVDDEQPQEQLGAFAAPAENEVNPDR